MHVGKRTGQGRFSLFYLYLTRTAEISGVTILFSRCHPEETALFPFLHSSLYYDLHLHLISNS